MNGKVPRLLTMAALAVLVCAVKSFGQGQELPAAPVPVIPSNPPLGESSKPAQLPAPAPLDAPAQPTTPPRPFLGGPPPLMPLGPMYGPIAPYQDYNGPLLRRDPLLDRPHAPEPGWFAAIELNVVAPQIKNR